MRSKQHDDPASTGTKLRRGERRANLSRMMAVVVHDENAVDFTFRLKPPSRSSKAVQPFDDLFKRNFQLEANRDRRQRVINVVHARHAQHHLANDIRSAPNIETRSEIAVVTDTMRR